MAPMQKRVVPTPVASGVVQGWRPDPFGRYEERYFSAGNPTALVRSGRVETRDEPTVSARPTSPAPPIVPKRPVSRRPRIYVRRVHRTRAAMVLVATLVTLVLGWELFVSSARAGLFGIVDFMFIGALLTVLVRMSRGSPRRGPPPGLRANSTSTTRP